MPYCLASTTIERPSGVSSASEASCAASASSDSATPGIGMNSEAWRLPSVIVPVLSSNSTSTSPEASTARPDRARTLRRTSRSMPAIPIAESSAPIVVGIKATSSAISVVSEIEVPANRPNGRSVATTIMKISVSAASRMSSAIMRSRNDLPGSCVISTTIRSEVTRVPPVTAERSPPDSRITGADSPVIADSSTEAMPSMISPSPGISSPAGTTHSSPTASSPDDFVLVEPSGSRTRATVSARVLRSVSACALPRPSATASAKLANNTVNQRNSATSPANTFSSCDDVPRSLKKRMVVRTEPTPTTNITGFFIRVRGLSLMMLSPIARFRISGSTSLRFSSVIRMAPDSVEDLELLDDGAESERRQEGEGTDDHDHADHQDHEQRSVGRERPRRRRDALLAHERTGQRERRDDQEEASEQHGDGEGAVHPRGVGREPGERRSVVVARRRERVEQLAEAVRTGVEDRRALHRADEHGARGEGEHDHGHHEDVDRHQLHVGGLDLLPQVLRCSSDHQSGDEHGEDRHHQQSVEPDADTSRAHLAELHVDHGDEAAARRVAVVHGVDRTVGRPRGR